MSNSQETKAKKEKGGFLSGIIHVGIGTVLNMIIGFISTPIITRMVVPEEYGKLSIFNLYISIAVMVLCFGLDQALVRYYYTKDTPRYRSGVARVCTGFSVLAGSAVAVIFAAVVILLRIDFEFADIIILFSVGIAVHLLHRFAVLVLRLEGKNKLYSFANVLNKALYVVLAIVLIYAGKDTSFVPLAFSTVAALLISTVAAILLARGVWFRRDSGIDGSGVTFSELMRYGMPFILSMGLTTLFQAISKIALNIFSDYATVGVFSSAMTLVNVFAIIQSTFNTVWMPAAVKHYEQAPEDKKFYSTCNSVITLIMFVFGLTVILFKDIFGVILGEKYREAAYLIPFLCFNPIMYTISETTVTGIVVKKKSAMHLVVASLACVCSAVGNVILVPIIGAKGAAISTGISYIVFYVLRTVISNRYYPVNYEQKKLAAVTLLTLCYAVYCTFRPFDWVCVVMYIMILAATLIIYSKTLKLIFGVLKSKLLKTKNN